MHVHCPACGGLLQPVGRAQQCATCERLHYRDPKVGVGVVVYDESSALLLVRRRFNPARGLWALPAGFVDADEDPRAAAARECLEETGLIVDVGAVLDVHASPGGQASFFLTFHATMTGGMLVPGDDADDAGYFPLDGLPPLAFASTLAAVAARRGL